MSFLKEIDQYIEPIRKALTNGSRIDINKIKDINRIYDNLRVEESIVIYGRQKSLKDLPKVDLSCGQCVKSMFEQIVIWHGKKSEPIVEFKGVPQTPSVDVDRMEDLYDAKIKVDEVKIDESKTTKDLTDVWDKVEDETVRPDQLSWGDFKRYCSEQGLRVKGKTKAELLKELEEIS